MHQKPPPRPWHEKVARFRRTVGLSLGVEVASPAMVTVTGESVEGAEIGADVLA